MNPESERQEVGPSPDPEASEQSAHIIKIARRSWYEWLGWAIWFFFILLLVQGALASRSEFEPTAATIFIVVTGVLLAVGLLNYLMRRKRIG